MNVYYTFTSKRGHFLTVKIWENIINYYVSTVCFPPEVDLHHPSLWLFLAQVVAIQSYFYNWKVLLITFLPFTLLQKIWHVMINFLFCICFYLILFYFLLLLLFYGRKYRTLWLIFYFVFVFILFYSLSLLLFFTRCCLSLFSFSCSWMSRRVASATGQNVTGTLGLGAVEQSGKQNRQDLNQHLLHFRLTALSVKMNAGLLSINSPRSVHQAQFAWEWAWLKN